MIIKIYKEKDIFKVGVHSCENDMIYFIREHYIFLVFIIIIYNSIPNMLAYLRMILSELLTH